MVLVLTVLSEAAQIVSLPHSKGPLPSLSSVRRNEVDDMYVLPALPPAEEKERSRSELEYVTLKKIMLPFVNRKWKAQLLSMYSKIIYFK